MISALICAPSAFAAARKTFSGSFGLTGSVITEDVSPAITEGALLAVAYSSALNFMDQSPWEIGVYSSLVFGQEGKSKWSIVPRFFWLASGEGFEPFTFSVGFGLGFTFLFLQMNSYAAFLTQLVVASDIDLGQGIFLGAESVVELPATNDFYNPISISVLLRMTHRW
ncbi:MAG: hypothetical protein HYR96_13525 [Deltaproteobacteria bacterium]|nr:hypothetical protein [Deltaproteobacteria bacterium]